MGFKTARRNCKGYNNTVKRMNSTVIEKKRCINRKNFILERTNKDYMYSDSQFDLWKVTKIMNVEILNKI